LTTLIVYHQSEAAEPPAEPLTIQADHAELDALMDLARPLSATPSYPPDKEDLIVRSLQCHRLCARYASSTAAIRSHVRKLLDPKASWTLVAFSRQCAVLARRARNPALIECGLIAHAIAGLRHRDVRDTLVALDELWKASVATAVNPAAAFNLAAGLAGPTMATIFHDVAAKRLGVIEISLDAATRRRRPTWRCSGRKPRFARLSPATLARPKGRSAAGASRGVSVHRDPRIVGEEGQLTEGRVHRSPAERDLVPTF
jgi:hypothetical protein